jgi:hypothetical protein
VINLATQALISNYSKSLHFDPKNPDAHFPTDRDEVGLVRAIIVKVCMYAPHMACCRLMLLSGTIIRKTETDVEDDPDKGKCLEPCAIST